MIVNLTRRPITLYREDWTSGRRELVPATTWPPAAAFVTVDSQDEGPAVTVTVDGVPVEIRRVRTVGAENLPDPQPGVWLIVPKRVADACPDRDDLVVPYRVVRDPDGEVVGCLSLGQPVRDEARSGAPDTPGLVAPRTTEAAAGTRGGPTASSGPRG